MSMPIVDHVCDKSQTQSSARTLLVILALHANDCCGLAWPAIETLRRKVNVSERQLHYDVKILRKVGAIQVVPGAGPHGTNLYRVVAPGIEPGAPDIAHVKGCRWREYLAALAGEAGVQPPAPGGDHPGAMDCTGGVQPIAEQGCNGLHPKTMKTREKNFARTREEETRASPAGASLPTTISAVLMEKFGLRYDHTTWPPPRQGRDTGGVVGAQEVPHTPTPGV
jgi:hypothetical protein